MNIVGLIARLAIGILLLVAGALKIGHFDVLASNIAAFRILPGAMVAPIAVGLPFFEVLLGGYIVLGLYTRTASLIATAEFVVFAAAIASVVMRGISAPCGCFGPGDTTPASWTEVGRDLVFALVAAIAAWRAPGMLALDNRIGAKE